MGVVACTGSKIIVSGSHYAHIVGETRGGFFNPSFSSFLFLFSSSVSAVLSRDLIGHSRAPCDLLRELRKKVKMVRNMKPQPASLFILLY